MKRILALFLVLVMAASCAIAEVATTTDLTDEAALEVEVPDELVIGHTTKLSGNFLNLIFGNNTADIDVWHLLDGYRFVHWDAAYGMYYYDPQVVGGTLVTEDSVTGDRTYTLALMKDLTWNDGTPITAKDYAFSLLLSAAPEIDEIGGNVRSTPAIVGMEAYRTGKSKTISGVRVISDYVISITIRAEFLPYFYELGLLNICPMPIAVMAPGCEVVDKGQGVFIQDIGGGNTKFTAELLTKTLLDPETGYNSHPSVTCGPYSLTGYDRESGEATFVKNEKYKGDALGRIPTIEKLVYRLTTNETAIGELQDGTLGLFNKAVRADTIDAGLADSTLQVTPYLRLGLNQLAFCCEQPTVSGKSVRQAIAYCFDADSFVDDYVGTYGIRAYGYYGVGQWMYQMVEGALEPPSPLGEKPTAAEVAEWEETLAEWEKLSLENLNHYDQDIDAAVALLVADGWTLNEKGRPFNAKRDAIRYKKTEDGSLIGLDLTMLVMEGNTFLNAVDTVLVEPLAKAGIKLTVKVLPFTELLSLYYREVPRDGVDMIFISTNFTEVFEPSYTIDPDDAMTHDANRYAIADKDLYERSVDMRKTEPGDLLTYCTKWVKFQEGWADVLPSIPIYTNVYYDFYFPFLQEYNVPENMTWSDAILEAVLAAPVTDEAGEEGDFDFDFGDFEEKPTEDGEEVFEF